MSRRLDQKGRYTAEVADMRQNSIVARIVLDELDSFWERVTLALNRLRVEEHDPDTQNAIAAAKTDIKAAIAARFGRPTSTAAVAMKCAISGWNLFDSENRQAVREELQRSGLRMYPFFHAKFSFRFSARYQRVERSLGYCG